MRRRKWLVMMVMSTAPPQQQLYDLLFLATIPCHVASLISSHLISSPTQTPTSSILPCYTYKMSFSWSSAVVGAATAVATSAILSSVPKDPIFHLVSIKLTSLKLNLPFSDAEVMMTIHVTNPNNVPISYNSTILSIFYEGSLIGTANVKAGSQSAKSCQLLQLPATLKSKEFANHASKFFADVARREMVMNATVDIEGVAKVLIYKHKFRCHVKSRVIVDPVMFDVIEQENKAEMELLVTD